jgi:hypothetical protein
MLKKNTLKIQCNGLECLEAFTRRYPKQFMSAVGAVAKGLEPLITDNELSSTYLALKVAYNLVKINTSNPADHNVVLKAVIKAVSNDAITGLAQDALSELLSISATNKLVDKIMVQTLLDTVSLKAQQAALCLAIVAYKDQTHSSLKSQFVQMVNDKNSKYQITGCLCLGEAGKIQDYSKEVAISTRIQ